MPESSVDANLFEFYEYASVAAGIPGNRRSCFSFIDLAPSPWPKAVYALDLDAKDGCLAELREGIASGAVPNKVRVGPSSLPFDAERLLAGAGFVPTKPSTGMALELKRRVRPRPTAGLSLSLLSSRDEYAASAKIVAENLFESGPGSGQAFASLLAALSSDRAFGFLGRAEGAAVSAAFAFIDGVGIGGVYFVATAREARGRGFGAETVSAALGELERRGVDRCILHATELGRPVYESLGFEHSCRLAIYSLPQGSLPIPAAS